MPRAFLLALCLLSPPLSLAGDAAAPGGGFLPDSFKAPKSLQDSMSCLRGLYARGEPAATGKDWAFLEDDVFFLLRSDTRALYRFHESWIGQVSLDALIPDKADRYRLYPPDSLFYIEWEQPSGDSRAARVRVLRRGSEETGDASLKARNLPLALEAVANPQEALFVLRKHLVERIDAMPLPRPDFSGDALRRMRSEEERDRYKLRLKRCGETGDENLARATRRKLKKVW